jgi:hypothetical protein
MDREQMEARKLDLRIGETDVGRGLFVTRDFTAGEEVFRFRGREIDFAGTLAKGERQCDAIQIGPDRYLDLEPPQVYINHSCDPNTGVRDDLRLVALRDLKAGEEIRFDYSTTMAEDHWILECRCGSPRCRGVIRDFKWLSDEWKRRLIRMDVVPRFILDAEGDCVGSALNGEDHGSLRQAAGAAESTDRLNALANRGCGIDALSAGPPEGLGTSPQAQSSA